MRNKIRDALILLVMYGSLLGVFVLPTTLKGLGIIALSWWFVLAPWFLLAGVVGVASIWLAFKSIDLD